jgi:hypothetical protein
MADADLRMHDDVEKTAYKGEKSSETSPAPGYDRDAQVRRGSVTPHHDGFFSAFTLESFKRNPNARVVTEATDLEGRPLPDQPPAEPALAMKLKPRHLQMIAIGGSIGMLSSKMIFVYQTNKILFRHWSLCWFWLCAGQWWPSLINYCIRIDWHNVILHSSCSW